MTNYIRKLLEDGAKQGYQFVIDGGGEEPDYKGTNVDEALEAIDAVEEATAIFYTENWLHRGFAFIINGVEEDERIADCNGWVSGWFETNIPS